MSPQLLRDIRLRQSARETQKMYLGFRLEEQRRAAQNWRIEVHQRLGHSVIVLPSRWHHT